MFWTHLDHYWVTVLFVYCVCVSNSFVFFTYSSVNILDNFPVLADSAEGDDVSIIVPPIYWNNSVFASEKSVYSERRHLVRKHGQEMSVYFVIVLALNVAELIQIFIELCCVWVIIKSKDVFSLMLFVEENFALLNRGRRIYFGSISVESCFLTASGDQGLRFESEQLLVLCLDLDEKRSGVLLWHERVGQSWGGDCDSDEE